MSDPANEPRKFTKALKLTSPYLEAPLVFHTGKELQEWAAIEAGAWAQLLTSSAAQSLLGKTQVISDHESRTRRLSQAAAHWASASLPADEGNALEEIRTEIKMYESGRLVPSNAGLGTHIRALFEADPIRSTATLSAASQSIGGDQFGWYKDHHFGGRFTEAIQGWIELSLFNRGLTGSTDRLTAALQELNKIRENFGAEITQVRSLGGQHLESIKASQQEASNAAQALTAKVQTDASHKFWIDRHQEYRTLADTFARHLRSYFIGALGFFAIVALAVFALARDVKAAETPAWLPLSVGLLLFMTVWIGRILHKQFTSFSALREDAAERAVMVKTYVALVKEGGTKPEHMNVVLQSLFRSATKADSDDGSPQLPTEIILKRIIGKE